MLVVMESGCTPAQVDAVLAKIRGMGYKPHEIPGTSRTAIGITGNAGAIDAREFELMPGVKEAIRVSKPYKLVSRETHPENTVVRVGDVEIGSGRFVTIAGPCSVESESQILAAARIAKAGGARLLRGGAYKPRTSPYAFQGLGEEGLKLLAKARAETGLAVVTEALDSRSLELVSEYADCVQIGARNMQNFSLLREAGRQRKPVMLKRGLSATIEELLMSAEYILSEGNRQVFLCERGVRTFADHSRNTLDLAAIPAVKKLSHLPILVDPSHAAGIRAMVPALARAGLAAGADGCMLELHPDPDKALSDGPQALTPQQFEDCMRSMRAVAAALGTSM
ncbi:MAG TPA: 3-deoxy-7-phosphoheptulonate synthase [Planctomycetota bacterium]|nr:3-deoxy-7-phosphoheptulonate synthase [Planctomycetota bacterium]